MCCTKAISKLILVIFNAVFFLLGAAVLAVGLFILLDKDYLIDTLSRISDEGEDAADSLEDSSILEGSSYALIAGGAFVFIIGFCGCCGALKESKCLLIIYASLVLVIFAIEVAAGVAVFFYKDKIEDRLQDFLFDTLIEEYEGTRYDSAGDLSEAPDALSAAWDFAQAYFECCGTYNASDYQSALAWNSTYTIPVGGIDYSITAQVPITCCKMVDNGKFPSKIDQVEFVNITECMVNMDPYATNTEGCYNEIYDLLMKYSKIVIGIGIGIALIEILGIVAACCLYRALKNDD